MPTELLSGCEKKNSPLLFFRPSNAIKRTQIRGFKVCGSVLAAPHTRYRCRFRFLTCPNGTCPRGLRTDKYYFHSVNYIIPRFTKFAVLSFVLFFYLLFCERLQHFYPFFVFISIHSRLFKLLVKSSSPSYVRTLPNI